MILNDNNIKHIIPEITLYYFMSLYEYRLNGSYFYLFIYLAHFSTSSLNRTCLTNFNIKTSI